MSSADVWRATRSVPLQDTRFLRKYHLVKPYEALLYRFYLPITRFLGSIVEHIWNATLAKYYFVKIFHSHRSVDMDVATMNFVRANTKIPVPRPCLQFRWLSFRYLIMERVPGTDLSNVWPFISTEERADIARQLKVYFDDLRSIPPPASPAICSVLGGPFVCARLHRLLEWCGPYRDQAHLNFQIRFGRPLEQFDSAIQNVHSTVYPLVFTHNDFAVHNIMVQHLDEGWKVTGIIDWECAAWLPSYWEYTKSYNWASGGSLDSERTWREWLPEILEPFEEERQVDRKVVPIPSIHCPE